MNNFWFGFGSASLVYWILFKLDQRSLKKLEEKRLNDFCDRLYEGLRKRGVTTLVMKDGGKE